MSLRRKSCDACYRGRQKCDLEYPTCRSCQRTKKDCHYVYPPIPSDTAAAGSSATLINGHDGSGQGISSCKPGPAAAATFIPQQLQVLDQVLDACDAGPTMLSFDNTPTQDLVHSSIPQWLGVLGLCHPIIGTTPSYMWTIEQFKSYPRAFAQNGETIFIHKKLYQTGTLGPLQTAFGISAASCCINETNQSLLFQCIDTEVLKLLSSEGYNKSLWQDVTRLQAMLLYQMVRLFYGDLKQRMMADYQEHLITMWALDLLQRLNSGVAAVPTNWEAWLLVESVRRTATIIFMLYGSSSLSRNGICSTYPTLISLPVSTKTALWSSIHNFTQELNPGHTVQYSDFSALYWRSVPKQLEPFEKMLLVACQGIEAVEQYYGFV